MDTYTRYKVRHAEVLLDRALDIRWTPEKEAPDEDMEVLWDSLTEQEKADLRTWLKEQDLI